MGVFGLGDWRGFARLCLSGFDHGGRAGLGRVCSLISPTMRTRLLSVWLLDFVSLTLDLHVPLSHLGCT